MSNGRQRRRFEPKVKADIVKRVLKDKKAVSEVCDEFAIGVTQYYGWQNEAFERLHRVFEQSESQDAEALEAVQVKQLKDKLARKDAVIAEMMTEIAKQKKLNGEL